MKKGLKRNNRGFSLVELIVVIAIMGILAVTLAPKLTGYIDKARQSNDKETINSIYTAVKLGLMEEDIFNDAEVLQGTTGSISLGKVTPGESFLYKKSTNGRTWEVNPSAIKVTSGSTTVNHVFYQQLSDVIGNFKLQSDKTHDTSQIIITITDDRKFSVSLYYNGTSGGVEADYTVNSDKVVG